MLIMQEVWDLYFDFHLSNTSPAQDTDNWVLSYHHGNMIAGNMIARNIPRTKSHTDSQKPPSSTFYLLEPPLSPLLIHTLNKPLIILTATQSSSGLNKHYLTHVTSSPCYMLYINYLIYIIYMDVEVVETFHSCPTLQSCRPPSIFLAHTSHRVTPALNWPHSKLRELGSRKSILLKSNFSSSAPNLYDYRVRQRNGANATKGGSEQNPSNLV